MKLCWLGGIFLTFNAHAMMDTPLQELDKPGMLTDDAGKDVIEFLAGTKVFGRVMPNKKEMASVVVFGVVDKKFGDCGSDDKIKKDASIYRYIRIEKKNEEGNGTKTLHSSGELIGKVLKDSSFYCVDQLDDDKNKLLYEIEGVASLKNFNKDSFPEISIRKLLSLKNPHLNDFSADFKRFSFDKFDTSKTPDLAVYQLWTARGISPSPGLEMVLGFYKGRLVFVAHSYDDLPPKKFSPVKSPFNEGHHLNLHIVEAASNPAKKVINSVLKSILMIP